MSGESICDYCGKRAPMQDWSVAWAKPADWYERRVNGHTQTACSWECVRKLNERQEAAKKAKDGEDGTDS